MQKNIKDLTGKTFNYLTVESLADKPSGTKTRGAFWNCVCKCGNRKVVRGDQLSNGGTKSCGCYNGGKKTHGQSKTKLYKVWCAMKSRCYREKDKAYYLYGGKGVKLYESWRSTFTNFYDWAYLNGYKEALTIERLDSNGDYCPENCKWADRIEQNNNTSRNVFVDGKTIGQHAREQGRSYSEVYYELRLKRS